MITKLQSMLDKGQDSALLRFTLASALAGSGEHERALPHLQRALEQDPRYSAAWKQLGRSLAELQRVDEARQAFTDGIACAQARGDKQAEREMRVFLKRLQKS